MTWLSEIEQRCRYARDHAKPPSETQEERMARVIRELVEKIREARNIANDTPEESNPQVLDDALTNIVVALRDEWSPDAKEVVNG